jgi:hypothetical protein
MFGRNLGINRQPFVVQLRQIVTKGSKKKFTAQNKKDGIPTDYIIVYSAGLTNNMYYCNIGVHIFIISSLVFAVVRSYQHYQKNKKMNIFQTPMASYILMPAVGMIFLFTIRGLALRTLLRIYYNETTDTFRAICISRNCITTKIIKFIPQEVEQKNITGYTKHYFGNLLINGRAYTVEDRDFRSPHYYNHMMQWEKPKYDEINDHIDTVFGTGKHKDQL